MDTLSWSSPGTGPLVMTETGTFWYDKTVSKYIDDFTKPVNF